MIINHVKVSYYFSMLLIKIFIAVMGLIAGFILNKINPMLTFIISK